jgi:acetyltransferase-like isoleucine patch superfamily enzyme
MMMDVPKLSSSPTKSPVKRSSVSPTKSSSPSKASLPDPKLRLHTNSICAKDTKLALKQGPLTLRSNSIIHPKVQIITPVEGTVLGRCSIISENCVVEETLRIGDYVLIEAGCKIAAKEIGDDCVIESAVALGERSIIGNNCRICAGEIIGPEEIISDGTVVFSNGRRRTSKAEQVIPNSCIKFVDVEISKKSTREAMCMAQC